MLVLIMLIILIGIGLYMITDEWIGSKCMGTFYIILGIVGLIINYA